MKADPKQPRPSLKRMEIFKSKVKVILNQLNLPILLLAATESDKYRKPRTGMWAEMVEEYDLEGPDSIDWEASHFVGDAAGREKDFSCSDRDLATNIGISFFSSDEYFLGTAPEKWKRQFDPSTYIPDANTAVDAYGVLVLYHFQSSN